MKRLYKYTGTVSEYIFRRHSPNAIGFADVILYDMADSYKAPVKIELIGGFADYINSIESTDAEERYITADWYYDDLLCLHRIEIPSIDSCIPAKIIAQHDAIEPAVTIFGPADYIQTSKPAPMDNEQRRAWFEYNARDEYRYTPRKADA